MPNSPRSLKSRSLKSNDGFIVIVALGILALLAIFGIIIQQTVQDTYQSVRNMNNYYVAQDIGGSITEYMLWQVSQHDVGYNSGKVTCLYGELADAEGGGNPDICQEFDNLAVADAGERQKDIRIEFEIKGRALDGENLRTEKCGTNPELVDFGIWDNNDSCYVVPFPGTGDIGKRCNGYEPVFDGAGSATVDSDLITGGNQDNNSFNNVDQVDYSCNWNKLSFGSSATDRVAIPLYYDDGSGTIVNPFNTAEVGDATTFALRLRTPCKPCGQPAEDGDLPQGTRLCLSGQDPTVCSDNDRFVLAVDNNPATDDDEIVVQWQLMGTCDDAAGDPQECGMVADSDEADSPIYKSRINEAAGSILIENDTKGLLTHIHPQSSGNLVVDGFDSPAQLPIYTQPILNIFLNEALVSQNEELNIPYLEYQVFTDKPISNPKSRVDVTVSVDGNAFTKTLFRENQQTIIDFAIQN